MTMSTTLFDLSGKIALVTGASRGIGQAIAELLAQQGAHVIVSSRKQEGCQTVADSIVEAGNSAEANACNIGDMAQVQNIIYHIRESQGRIVIMVINHDTYTIY